MTTTTPNGTPQVFAAISKIGAEIVNSGGISKDRKNQSQGYSFRGVEDFLNVLAPLLPKHGIVIAPRLIHRELFERTTAKGGTMFHAIAEYEFDFICAGDGSKMVVGPVIGEAMDSGDKAHNKTLSMAYKYAVMLAFCIPTEVDDADGQSPEVVPQEKPALVPGTSPLPPAVHAHQWTRDLQEWAQFATTAKELGLSQETVKNVLEVKSFHDYRGTREQATAAIRKFAEQTNITV